MGNLQPRLVIEPVEARLHHLLQSINLPTRSDFEQYHNQSLAHSETMTKYLADSIQQAAQYTVDTQIKLADQNLQHR
jgi:hypothetical protein